MPVNCRIARAADLPALCVLGREVNLLHHAAMPDVFAPPEDSDRDAGLWAEAIEGPDNVAFVAEKGSRVIGFLTATMADEEITFFRPQRYCCIGVMGVEVAERGRGVGRMLMAAVEQWAQAHSAAEVHLHVWTFNEAAVRLYAELGYEPRTQLMAKRLSHLEP
jgi:ribosomal protein S18 acetylase RimI-like enzyme